MKECPQIPFFGASYPDATCIDGILYDLDSCDENGNLYDYSEHIPCPFCRTEEFIKYDYFNIESELNTGNEEETKELVREWYMVWINEMKKNYGEEI